MVFIDGFSGSDKDVLGNTLGYLGMLGAWFLFLSQIPTMRIIRAENDVKEYSEIPAVVSLANCVLWVMYSAVKGDVLQAFICNVGGVILQTIYCFMFLKYSAGGPRARSIRRNWYLTLAFILFVEVFVEGIMPYVHIPDFLGMADDNHTKKEAAQIDVLGILASTFNTGMYAAPLAAMGEVIRTKSVESMPLGLTLGSVACSVVWTLYSLYLSDVFIGIPNWLGLLLGAAQVTLYCTYCSNDARYAKPQWWVDSANSGRRRSQKSEGEDQPYTLI